MKAVYPCVISWDKDDETYYVTFPDLEEIQTDGTDLYDAVEKGEDALNLLLLNYESEHEGNKPPAPSDIKRLDLKGNERATLIRADTDSYQNQPESPLL